MDENFVRHVTPTTTALLRWWFRPDEAAACNGFSDCEREAILDTISAHEAIDRTSPCLAMPTHRLALSNRSQQLQVMLALLVWQLLNHFAARAAGVNDRRFTHQFVLMAPYASIRNRLLDALLGPRTPSSVSERDASQSEVARLAGHFMPGARQGEFLAFVLNNTVVGSQRLEQAWDEGVIVITDDRLEALECLARLPNAMVFDDEARPPYRIRHEDPAISLGWRRHLRRFAAARRGHGTQVLFTMPRVGNGPLPCAGDVPGVVTR